MRTFVLFGIDKYHVPHLLTVVRAESLEKAGDKLGGSVEDAGGSERPAFRTCFELGGSCGVFKPGICTPEVLALACATGGLNDVDMVAHCRYRFQYVFREVLIGTVPWLD